MAWLWPLLLCALAVLFSVQAKTSGYQSFHKQPKDVTCSKLKPSAKQAVPEPKDSRDQLISVVVVATEEPKLHGQHSYIENVDESLSARKNLVPRSLFFRPPPAV